METEEEMAALPLIIGRGETPIPKDPSNVFELVEASKFIQVANARKDFKVSGKGLGAAILDTGINKYHEDFGNRVKQTLDFTNGSTNPDNDAEDDNGHGTHVAGIVAANRHHIGIAPEADIYAIKIINNDKGKISWLVDALNWIDQNSDGNNISVISISLSDKKNYKSEKDLLKSKEYAKFDSVIKKLYDKRIPVVAAAGNMYASFSSKEGMGFPAIFNQIISVGAVFDADIGNIKYDEFGGARAHSTSEGQITPFSQRLSQNSSSKNYTKLFSPGSPITSTGKNSNSGGATQNGTSQAAPVVTGVILLLQELYKKRNRELPPIPLLLECLQSGGVKIRDDNTNDNVNHTRAEFFRLDAYSALDYMSKVISST